MIRNAEFSDEQSIITLGKLVNPNYENLFDLKNILNSDYAKMLVLEENNKIIGFIHYNILADNIDIINVVVDLDKRLQGYANLLLGNVITKAEKKVNSITLEVASNNEAAQKLYIKNGFEIVSVRKKYYGEEDGLLMKRWIK